MRAEEGGSGHYLPGATASFIDALPGKEAFACLDAFTYYNGSAGGSRQLPLGGMLAANIDATAYADTAILIYETPWKLFGGQYAVGAAIPYIWMDVKADVQHAGTLGGRQFVAASDGADGVGDIEILPVMFGWTEGDLRFGGRLGLYTPTGEYNKGHLANVGKNYWTFEPGLNVSWLGSQSGMEVSLFAGCDFNTKNDKTDYQSGDVFHVDGTVAEHLPLLGGFMGVGANAFYYLQISRDSGSGTVLGDFEGQTIGVGPVLSYTHKLGKKTDFVAEVKWLPELDVTKRLKGDAIWFKLALVF
ncbi:MAG TPA: transporter [Verrucomicrobiae bacterium]